MFTSFKKIFFFSVFSLFTIIFFSCNQAKTTNTEIKKVDKYDGPDKALAFEVERTKNPFTNQVPWGKLIPALEATAVSKANSLTENTNALSWVERGPNSDVAGINTNTRPNNDVTAGRIRAVMLDSLDPAKKTVFAGGISGGLWKTNDVTSNPANWILVNDFLSNLAVSSICQDPRVGNQNNMYFCTGESFGNLGAVRGVGVFKSTDAGATWNLLPSTINFLSGTKIICDNNGNIYLGTRGNGILRSINGGASWANITPSGLGFNVSDIELSSTGRLHLSLGIFSVQSYRFTDSPTTANTTDNWVAPTTAYPSFNNRSEITVSGNVLYALPANASDQVPTIYKSTDGGDTWNPTQGQPPSTWASGQGWYALSAGINPTNVNDCIIGGLDTYRTTDGGISWNRASVWVGTTGQYVHADQHNLIWWDNGNKIVYACDGGIHYSGNGGVTIRDRNVGLRLKQFYSVAMHPTTTNFFIAGAQDNGMHRLTEAGLGASVEVTGGDGAYTAIDQNEPLFQFGAFVFNTYRRSTNGGNNWSTVTFSTTAGRFINPFDYANTENIFYAAHTAGQYLRWNNPQTGNTNDLVPIAEFGGGTVSAVHASPYTLNRVYFGTGGGRLVRVDNAESITPTASIITPAGAAGYLNCVVTGTSDDNLLACYSSYGVNNVWRTTNGGTSWTACDGNLPDMPVRWALLNPDDNTKAFIATETGVWETDLLNAASTVWAANPSFPSVSTHMLKYRTSDRTVAAATYGRGVWSAILPPAGPCTATAITTQPTPANTCAGVSTSFSITATGTGTVQYQWQQNNGAGFTNITGATAATYTFIPTFTQNNYLYRCVVAGTCAPTTVTSSEVLLTVSELPTITAQPIAASTCTGSNASFSISATGAGISYQWQVSATPGCNGVWANVANGAEYNGVNTATLNITNASIVLNNNNYRCVVFGSCAPSATSNCGTLTVASSSTITTQPNSATVCVGATASFTVAATGGGLNYQWQQNNGSGFVNIGTNNATLSFATNASQNGYVYKCIITGACIATSLESNVATLTLNTAPIITSQPVASTICANTSTSFNVNATGTSVQYQWQISTTGCAGSWQNITNAAPYSGSNSTTLQITNAPASLNNAAYRCVVTGTCTPAATSSCVLLTVNDAPAINQQPASVLTCAGNTAIFSTTATNANSFQWQVNLGAGFVNVVGANAATYSFVTNLSQNNNQYRCVVGGACAPTATSNAATLNVAAALSISTQPSDVSVCENLNTSFNVSVTGAVNNYQWQLSTDNGATFTNISNSTIYAGATTNNLALTGITNTMNNYKYRCVVTGSCPPINSNIATLTVNNLPTITTQPIANRTICDGQSTTIAVTATGTIPTYQWQVSTNGGTSFVALTNTSFYTGVNTALLNITNGTLPLNGNLYRCLVSGTCSPSATSNSCILNVSLPASITQQPTNKVVCDGGNTSFSVTAAGTTPSYQWQVSTNSGTTFTNIANATNSTLSIANATASMNNNLYRVLVSNLGSCNTATSTNATLTISAKPVVNFTAIPYLNVLPGLSTTLTATSSIPAASATYTWYVNNTIFTNTSSSYLVNVNNVGTYKVVVANNTNGCFNEAVITIGDSVSNRLFVYPSPNNGLFNVAYYNASTTPTNQSISIFDSKGAIVYNKRILVSQAYQIHNIDMSKNASGIYVIVVGDANGTVLKTEKVVIN